MALLPDRHPNRDFFVLDIADVVPKDDTASMEHPIFSLSTKPDHRHLRYQSGEHSLSIIPSGKGLPTIFDKDILIFCISQLMHKKNRGEKIGKRVRFNAHELLIATNRKTGGIEYQRLEDAFVRLGGTQFKTDITTGGKREVRLFSLVDPGSGFVFKDDDRMRLDYCEIILSDWIMRAIEATEVVTIAPEYFRLRRPLERRIYELARKHCGAQPRWQIRLAKLQEKTGSNAPLKKFRLNLREIIENDHTPFYQMELTKEDMVIFRPRSGKAKRELEDQDLAVIPPLAPDTYEKARRAAPGWDIYALETEWREWAKETPRDADAAFLGFCKQRGELK